MDRRTLLRAGLVGVATALSGCLGGEVVHEVRRQVRVEPGEYWLSRLPSVDGNGAISYSVRADQRFDLYVFTDQEDLDAYQTYHENRQPERTPTGHNRLGGIAASTDEPGRFVAQTDNDGSRESYSAESEWYFVVDHSAYAGGIPPGEHPDALSAFVDLQIVDKQLPL